MVITEVDAHERAGERPYEMVWANRSEPYPPSLGFAQLKGFSLEVTGGAQATLRVSRAQNIWGRLVGRLEYHGDGSSASTPRIRVYPPAPLPLPPDADSADMWIYGNRWDWQNPADTPAVTITMRLRDGAGLVHSVWLDRIRWREWWLLHRRLPINLIKPVSLESLEISGGWQKELRTLFFDALHFYREPWPPLQFQTRPQRNLTLLDGQSVGANTGPGRLPFPIREQTILPQQIIGGFHIRQEEIGPGKYQFSYAGRDGAITYEFEAGQGLGGIRARFNRAFVGVMMDGGGVRLTSPSPKMAFQTSQLKNGVVKADYGDGTSLLIRLWQKSLVVDVINRTGLADTVEFGSVRGTMEPRTMTIPYLTYGGNDPRILLARAGQARIFASLWADWYRSNGSEPYGVGPAHSNKICMNGGVKYLPLTDGRRNPVFERLFLTISPRLEEVLPTIPNPASLHAVKAVDRLWQSSWGPDDYGRQLERGARLRAYGIEKFIQCEHENLWCDGGESFTLRLHGAPQKGGDEALAHYIKNQQRSGWLVAPYFNYTDYAPVNEFWHPDGVQRTENGDWRPAWQRCWALKSLRAAELEQALAPLLQQKYQPKAAYTDVHTAAAPWLYTDFDARVPGAGTFTQTLYAYGELLRNESRVFRGPVFSEGTYQWLYAGLADGNYGLAYTGRSLVQEPLLPVFDLMQIHPKECDIGMGWTAQFCEGMPNWRAPENIDRAIDRFLLHTLAYGHIGWLVEEEHGLARTCRSYFMIQAVQARYGLQAPRSIRYWDGERLQDVSEAVARDLPRDRRQLCVSYPWGLRLWFNDHPTEKWCVKLGCRDVYLPPAGWAAFTAEDDLVTYSGLSGTNRVDYLYCSDYTYLDGRGHWFATPWAASNGAMMISPLRGNRLQIIRISGDGAFYVKRPYHRTGRVVAITAFNAAGKRLANPAMKDNGCVTRIEPIADAVRYAVQFFDGSSRFPEK